MNENEVNENKIKKWNKNDLIRIRKSKRQQLLVLLIRKKAICVRNSHVVKRFDKSDKTNNTCAWLYAPMC